MELKMPRNSKFACLALKNTSIANDLELPININDMVWISGKPSLSLEPHWKENLGKFQTNDFENSNLFIISFKPSLNLEVLDQENVDLKREIIYFLEGLILQGIPDYTKALLITGAIKLTDAGIRQFLRIDWKPINNALANPKFIDKDSLIKASKIGKTLLDIYDEKNQGNYIRFKKGFHAWRKGVDEQIPDERLHQLVRGIESFLNLPIGRSKKTFVHRGNLILGRKEKTKKFLDEIYDLRSCAEHMNDFDEVFKHYPENNRNDTGLLRCYQVEIFSSKLFLKLLSDQTLLDIIKSDVALGELWKKPDDAIMNILGDSINIPFELN